MSTPRHETSSTSSNIIPIALLIITHSYPSPFSLGHSPRTSSSAFRHCQLASSLKGGICRAKKRWVPMMMKTVSLVGAGAVKKRYYHSNAFKPLLSPKSLSTSYTSSSSSSSSSSSFSASSSPSSLLSFCICYIRV